MCFSGMMLFTELFGMENSGVGGFFFFHQDLLVLHVIKYCAVNMTDVQRKKKYSLALHSK